MLLLDADIRCSSYMIEKCPQKRLDKDLKTQNGGSTSVTLEGQYLISPLLQRIVITLLQEFRSPTTTLVDHSAVPF
jgi:hypothetical protein